MDLTRRRNIQLAGGNRKHELCASPGRPRAKLVLRKYPSKLNPKVFSVGSPVYSKFNALHKPRLNHVETGNKTNSSQPAFQGKGNTISQLMVESRLGQRTTCTTTPTKEAASPVSKLFCLHKKLMFN